jgi:hypothetical protein
MTSINRLKAIALCSIMAFKTRLSFVVKGFGSLLIASSLLLTGCGGGGGGVSSSGGTPPAAITFGGVAAVGTPIAGGAVSVFCASGATITPVNTDTQGKWTVTLTNQTLPCAVEVSGGTINSVTNSTSYHSIATAAGTVNITPLTDLIIANMVGSATPSAWFAGLSASPSTLSNYGSSQVGTAYSKVVSAMNGLANLSTNNPITTTFTPSSGNVVDDMLTALAVAMTNTGVSYPTLLSNASASTFTPVSGFNTALTAAYSLTSSGYSGGPSTSTSNPGITGVVPSSAAPGATVTISGTNFAAGTTLLSGSNYQVSFNGTTATPSARTLTQLVVIVPTGATSGTLTVTDLTTHVVYTVPGGFTVTSTPVASGNTCSPSTNLTAQSGTAVWQNSTQMVSALSGTWSGCDLYGKVATITFGTTISGTISQHTNYYATYTNCTYTLKPWYFYPANGQVDYTVSAMACDQGSGLDTVHGDVFTIYTNGGTGAASSLILQMDFLNFAAVTHQ